MYTKQLLALTLLATSLTLNAALPKEYLRSYKQQTKSITSLLGSVLYKRGIEKENALEISKKFIGEDEELFTLMFNNLLNYTPLKQEELLEKLSHMALQKKALDLTSYASLLKLTQQLNGAYQNQEELDKLKLVAQRNNALKKIFS